jgi:hypothetical protein
MCMYVYLSIETKTIEAMQADQVFFRYIHTHCTTSTRSWMLLAKSTS